MCKVFQGPIERIFLWPIRAGSDPGRPGNSPGCRIAVWRVTGSAGSRAVSRRLATASTRAAGSWARAGTSAPSCHASPFGWRSPPARSTKASFRAGDVLQCDEHGATVGRTAAKPSAETLLHIEIARRRGAGAVLHTHSVWTTVLSDLHAAAGGFTIEGYEMLKGLHGVRSHDHREWIPILANDQNMPRLAQRVGETLDRFPRRTRSCCAATVSTPGATRSRTPNGTSRFWSSCSKRSVGRGGGSRSAIHNFEL